MLILDGLQTMHTLFLPCGQAHSNIEAWQGSPHPRSLYG